MKKVAWMMVVGVMMTASYGFGQEHKKEDVPRDVHMSNMMKKNLELTEEQYEKVLEMNKSFELENKELMAKRRELIKKRNDQLKEVLTEEQWKTWKERERHGKRGKPGRGPGKGGPDND